MDESTEPPPVDRVDELLAAGRLEEVRACLDHLETVASDDRKAVLRSLRDLAADRSAAFEGITPALVSFLDDERAVRLTAVKLLVAVAEDVPEVVRPVVDPLADRLADDEEFYFVRARSAEALGYVALADPEAVATPEVVAELRIGLEFDEPEVTAKLAKALAHVALADPRRLRHQVGKLAAHLDDEQAVVRYHLCTALVATGCEHPNALADGRDALVARLDDDNEYVRGRVAEALGLYAGTVAASDLPVDDVERLVDDESSFVSPRAAFALAALDSTDEAVPHGRIPEIESIRNATDRIADEITTPTTDGECPHCGLELPDGGPPVCPGCGAPR